MSADDQTQEGAPQQAAAPSGPYVSEDGQTMGRDFVIPGVDPAEPDPYRFHTGRKRDHGGEDAIEIIDLTKQFGRARILNGLNLGLPEDQVSMVLGPSGTGKSVLIKHIVGLLAPGLGRRPRARRIDPEHDRRRTLRGPQKVRAALPGRRPVRLDEHLRQHRLPAAPAHRQKRGRDRRDRQPPPARGGAHRGDLQDAERALRRDAQARRLRPGAGPRTGRSSCSTSPTPASTRSARRCSAS